MDRLKFVKNNMPGIVLDVGCAKGDFHKLIYREGVYGLDIVDECSIKNNFFVGDAQKMPFKDNFFDTVIAGELIEHLEHPEKFLSETNRVLKDGGAVILSTPNRKSLYNRLTNRYKHEWHKNLFSEAELKELVKKNGFKIEEFSIIPYDESSCWGAQHKTILGIRRILCYILPKCLKEDMLLLARKFNSGRK
jgi:ubiquinone/menaquinone biosynthesis C-methylase UbiE